MVRKVFAESFVNFVGGRASVTNGLKVRQDASPKRPSSSIARHRLAKNTSVRDVPWREDDPSTSKARALTTAASMAISFAAPRPGNR
jgi:hypothetical protein